MAHLRLTIPGLAGAEAQQVVERALLDLPGMWSAVVCLDQGYADVEYADDNGPSPEAVLAAVRNAGYPARLGG